MPLLQINAFGDRPGLHGPGELDAALAAALARLPAAAPVIVIVHGYRFSPFAAAADPHRHILSLAPHRGCRRALSWPRHLGFGRADPAEGLCIAFGWEARGTIWGAWSRAGAAGRALADAIGRIGRHRRGPVCVVGHSLGARVALAAMAALEAPAIGRTVLLAAAEYQSTARRALASPAGRLAEIVNVTTRENDLFDVLVEWLVRRPRPGDRALGAGLGQAANWLDLQIDCPATRDALGRIGHRIAAPSRRVCHWSPYLRPGLFPLYREFLRRPDRLPLDALRALVPADPAPRWSRICPRLPRLPGSAPARRRPAGASHGRVTTG